MSAWSWILIVVAVILLVVLITLFAREKKKNKKPATVKPDKPEPAVANKIVFKTGPQTIKAGSVSEIITIQIQDVNGKPVMVTSTTEITLSSSSAGVFSANSNGLPVITSVTVYGATDSASFYYKDSAKGSPTIIAFNKGLVPAKQTETIN